MEDIYKNRKEKQTEFRCKKLNSKKGGVSPRFGSFFASCLPSFFPSFLLSFLPSFLPSFFPSFLPLPNNTQKKKVISSIILHNTHKTLEKTSIHLFVKSLLRWYWVFPLLENSRRRTRRRRRRRGSQISAKSSCKMRLADMMAHSGFIAFKESTDGTRCCRRSFVVGISSCSSSSSSIGRDASLVRRL